MDQLVKITFLGIEISISEESDGSFSAYFSNAPGNFAELHTVKPLKKNKSLQEAEVQGKKFVSDHQWENTGERFGIFELYIRLWWNEEWAYGIWVGDSKTNSKGFKTKDEALSAGRIKAKEMDSELEKNFN